MLHFRFKKKSQKEKGFTIVELVVIAPVVILTIGAFVTVIIGLTGDVLASRASNTALFNIQDGLNRMEQDIKLSSSFLATNTITPQTGQGFDDNIAGFKNADNTNGTMLILNSIATTGNPIQSGTAYVYAIDPLNACSSAQVIQNTPQSMNVIYFLKAGTLWRRVIMQQNYANITTNWCAVPWQEPSCTLGFTAPFCKTQDIQLVSGLGTAGFTVQYYNGANNNRENLTASNPSVTDINRAAALVSSTTASINLSSSQTVAGRTIAQTATIRVTRLDINASSIVIPTVAVTPTTPVVTATLTGISAPTSATFTWPQISGANSYKADYNINGGSWVLGSPQAGTSFTVVGIRNKTINIRVVATNSAGTSAYGTATITIPLWTSFVAQNGWTDYGSPYATAAWTQTSDGLIVFKGVIATPPNGLTVATLPLGYQPSLALMFTTETNSNIASRVDIGADGTIQFQAGSNGWLSLDGIEFLPSTSAYTYTPMTLSNGWVNYGGSFQTAGYTIDAENRTHIQGLIKSGTQTSASVISTLPTLYLPSLYQELNVASNNSYGSIAAAQTNSVHPGPGIQYKTGSNSFLSLNNMFYTSALGHSSSCPDATTGWCALTLQNGWLVNANPTVFTIPQYTKSTDGVVSLEGFIASGTTTAGTVITTLPVGYRPASSLLIEVYTGATSGRVDIDNLGNLTAQSVSNSSLFLDGVNFIAEQ